MAKKNIPDSKFGRPPLQGLPHVHLWININLVMTTSTCSSFCWISFAVKTAVIQLEFNFWENNGNCRKAELVGLRAMCHAYVICVTIQVLPLEYCPSRHYSRSHGL